MLGAIEAGKVNCVVVKDLSRLGRNTIDTGYYIEKYFPLHGTRFIAVNDQFDSEDSENSGNHLIVPLKNMINEAYAADISRKVRAQQRQAMRDGEFVGARPPYGYRKAPDNCHRLLVNEDTAPVVQQIFQWAFDGVPLNVIVKQLNEANIQTPGFYLASIGLSKRPIGSGKWQTWTVGKILEDEIYTGDMVQGKHTSVGHKQIHTDPKNWIVVRGTHEPLVSREVFERVQVIREQAAKRSKSQAERIPYTLNILRGRVFCGCCGRNLHRQRHQCGYYLYHCISNDRIGKGACAGKVYLREEDLFHTIVGIIQQQAKGIIGNSLRLKQRNYKFVEQKAAVDAEISELRLQAAKNRDLLAGLYESFVKGILTRTEYLELKETYSRKLQDAVERVQQFQTRQAELERQMEQYTSLADRLAAVDEDTTLSALLVDQTIERITVNSSDDISIDFTFDSGFERVMEMLGNE